MAPGWGHALRVARAGLREGAPLERIWAPRIDQSDPPRSWPLPCDRALTSP